MNILYLAHRIPYPPNKGDKIRSFNEIKYLAVNHTVDLICLADDPDDLQYKETLQKYCRKVFVHPISTAWSKLKGLTGFVIGKSISVSYFYRKVVQKMFDQWLAAENYDAVICFSSSMAEYILETELKNTKRKGNTLKKPRLIMDFCDIDSDKWLQYSRESAFPMKQIYQAENTRLQAYEKKAYRTFDTSIVVTDQEKDLFLQVCPTADDMVVMPNGVDTEYFAPHVFTPHANEIKEPSLVFTGAMDYHANVDGVCWFCEDIFPKVRYSIPEVQFYIVGRNPAPAVKKLRSLPGLHVVGTVEDIRLWYQKADVYVVPLRLARGVQNKVLEAMSMGKAVVSTSRVNGGIGAAVGQQLLIADTADDFATSILILLQEQGKRLSLGNSARNFVINGYNWKKNMQIMESYL